MQGKRWPTIILPDVHVVLQCVLQKLKAAEERKVHLQHSQVSLLGTGCATILPAMLPNQQA
jgi:hypothetical protein